MLVSSANEIGTDLSFMNLGKSFINIRGSKGPKTELCDMPCSTLDQVDVVILPFSLYSILISILQIGFVKFIMVTSYTIKIKFS